MNAKKAKGLRKVLRNLVSSAGNKLRDDAYVENIEARKMIEVDEKQLDGTIIKKKIPIAAGTIRNAQDSKRAIYRILKSEVHKVEAFKQKITTAPLIEEVEAKPA